MSYYNNKLLYERHIGYKGDSDVTDEPIEILGRIEPSNKIIKSVDKGDVQSSSKVYTEHNVERGGYISFGGDRFQILLVEPQFGLEGELVYNKVYLG